ncbi:hypothetical protein F5Y00DRAFT_272121 [Daldinia vernicosa]|uniref:uncharacterized protein n=1 Tax=Daldinia vernicosa TaxID=114800 RepID=UPI002008BBEC|nr:uncharacterized protein F5Y00DRAFT_272121 [Daldinia vernicosa]KAI0846327.1 hypothetical protein F5Y00DRAFT_272121 [Daldinia vernicosa]
MANANHKRAHPFTADPYDEPPKRPRPRPRPSSSFYTYEDPPLDDPFTRPTFNRDAPYHGFHPDHGFYPDHFSSQSSRPRDPTNATFAQPFDHFDYFDHLPDYLPNPRRQYPRERYDDFNPPPASHTGYRFRSNTMPSRPREPTYNFQDSFQAQNPQRGPGPDHLHARVAELEALVKSLTRSYNDFRLPRAAVIRGLRRDIDNLSRLEGQTNELEARVHEMSRTLHDLQASTEADNVNDEYTESEIHQDAATQARTRMPELDKAINDGNDDSDDDVVFLGERPLQDSDFNIHNNHSNRGSYQLEAITRDNFVPYLKSLDFRAPYGMEAFVNTPVTARDYRLCTLNDGTIYFVRLGTSEKGWWNIEYEPYERAPLMLPRYRRGHLDGDQHLDARRLPSLLQYRSNVCEVEYPASNSVLAPPLCYALPLGEIHVYQPRVGKAPPDLIGTNFFLLMDVTNSRKSLWIVYAYEYPSNKNNDPNRSEGYQHEEGTIETAKYELSRNSPLCADFGLFDVACIANSLDDFANVTKGDVPNPRGHQQTIYPQLDPVKVHQMLRSTACIAQPVFTEPNLDRLAQAINQGWKK